MEGDKLEKRVVNLFSDWQNIEQDLSTMEEADLRALRDGLEHGQAKLNDSGFENSQAAFIMGYFKTLVIHIGRSRGFHL